MRKSRPMPLLDMLFTETTKVTSPSPIVVRESRTLIGERVLVIFNSQDVEISHFNCPLDNLDSMLRSSKNKDHRVEVYEKEDYYAKMKNNEFQMSHENWGVMKTPNKKYDENKNNQSSADYAGEAVSPAESRSRI